jgi:hypothetical protein
MDSNKLESYLINLDLTYEKLDSYTWLITDPEKGLENVFIIFEEPLVILRVDVMQVPKKNREALFEKLLTLNGSDLIHGAYALDNEKIIITETFVHDTIDFEEFQASLDAVSLALAQHYPVLTKYREP